jgi:hypothetical protein
VTCSKTSDWAGRIAAEIRRRARCRLKNIAGRRYTQMNTDTKA